MKELLYKLRWLDILFSPLKLPHLRFYFGRISMGTPIFYPRKWRRVTAIEAIKSATDSFNNPKFVKKSWGEWYEYHKGCQKPVYLKWFGVNLVGHGWKTKYDFYRHEWNPMLSVVLLKRQFCIFVGHRDREANDYYWEAYLYYKYETDKNKPKLERLKEVFDQYSCTWGNPDKGYTNHYYSILKRKYHKYIPR